MDSAKWKEIKAVFSETLELPHNEREAYLAAEADIQVRIEAAKLLAAYEKADDFIESPIFVNSEKANDIDADSLIGTAIDGYEIIEKIGTGGMGSVYLAHRLNSDFTQRVALKVIKRGMDSEAILKRFATERRILSTLKHPNVAQMLDGGISSESLPFFVMEFVEGKPLQEYCRENNLSLKNRLLLFRKICSAVEYAHKNLVVHRDLKPSNILVTADGTPKLLDFGIGKTLTDIDVDITATQAKIFTPEYASPEQIRGQIVTTSTDVYSLGVLFFELLTAKRPYDVKGKSFDEIIHTVCETEPPRPSETGECRHLTSERENEDRQIPKSELRGDLDTIVLKALRKNPADRYGSVQQFSEDISRYLKGLPIFARPQTLVYRFRKYAKRHTLGIAAAGLILVSLIGGVSIATWQAIIAERERAKAEQRFNDVRKLANTILFDHYERISKLPGATEARLKLVSDALIYLDSLATESTDDPDLQRELSSGYRKLAMIQGSTADGGNSGDNRASSENYLKALTIQEALVSSNNANIEDQRNLGKLYSDINLAVENQSDQQASEAYIEKGLRIFEKLRITNPNRTQADSDYANALWSWANVIRVNGDNNASIETYKQALEIYDSLGVGDEKPLVYKRNAALTRKNVGAIYMINKEFQKALEYYQRAFVFDKENADSSPNNTEVQLDLSFTYASIAGAFVNLDENEKALPEYQKAIEIQERISKADPKNKFAGFALFQSYNKTADVYLEMANFENAKFYYEKSETIIKLEDTEAMDINQKINVADHLSSLGKFFLKRSETAKTNSQKLTDLKAASQKFTASMAIYQALSDKGILDPAYSANPTEIAEALLKTKVEISRLIGK